MSLIPVRQSGKFIAFFISIWALTLISTPIMIWAFGNRALVLMVNLGVILQIFAVMAILLCDPGWKKFLVIGLSVVPLAWLAEFVGSRTGFPFGSYSYTAVLRPQLGGVPLLIPLAWLMMLFPAWGLADQILKNNRPRLSPMGARLLRALVGALTFTAWDLSLDPQMVKWGLWTWKSPGIYFGIPLTNYIGWFLVSFLITFFLVPKDLPAPRLGLIYALTSALQFIGQVMFWKLPGPGLFGFIGMGGLLLWAFFRKRK